MVEAYIFKVFLGIDLVGVPRFVGLQTESLGQFALFIGRKDTLSKILDSPISCLYFLTFRFEFRLSFQQNRTFQNKVEVERLGVMSYRGNLSGPGTWHTQIC